MKFGIYLPNFGSYGEARVLANLAQDAENSGWDGFFIWDHIAGLTLPMVDPWVALAAIAVTTHRIRIGTTVTPLPRRRPWKLAREAVSIDHLSGGRLTLGVGIGGGESEWAHLGEQPDLKKRGAMLDEALSVLVGYGVVNRSAMRGNIITSRMHIFYPNHYSSLTFLFGWVGTGQIKHPFEGPQNGMEHFLCSRLKIMHKSSPNWMTWSVT